MSIIISKSGENATRIERSVIEKEDYLQNYIANNPESLPLHEVKEDIRLLIAAREFPVLSGYIDALGLDGEGGLYVVETKLYKNPDKRLVIAQILDYAASLWKTYSDSSSFIDQLEENATKRFGIGLRAKLCEFYGFEEEDISAYLNTLKQNISNGIFRFVVLMDRLDDRLKDLILFVNSNSKFDILGVELDFYQHKDFEIIIPKLYGAELKKAVSNPNSAASGMKWDHESFFLHVTQSLGPDSAAAIKKVHDWSQANGGIIAWGKRHSVGGFTVTFPTIMPKTLFFVRGDGILQIYFPNLAEKGATEAEKFGALLSNAGFELPRDFRSKFVNFRLNAWSPRISSFTEGVNTLLGF